MTLSKRKIGLTKFLLLLWIVIMACEPVFGQDKTEQLLEHSVIPYHSKTGEFTTEFKEEIRRVLQDVRILSLGESSHEDGATFEHKTRLVKFLHEELGYNVLAFEFGFYGHWKINQKIESGEDVKTTTRYAGWSSSKDAYPVYKYIGETKRSNTPLILAGFDSEKVPDGIPNTQNFLENVIDLTKFHITNIDSLTVDSLLLAVYGGIGNQISQEITYSARNRAKAIVDSLSVRLKEKEETLVAEVGEEKFMMYQLTLKSILMDEKIRFAGAYWNIVRDKSMAERVRWLADSLYKGEKIILWGASGHFARNMISIDRNLDPGSYGFYPYYQMGDWLYEFFGDDYYSLVFTTATGQNGLVFPDGHRFKQYEEIRTIEVPKEGSFEATAMNLGVESLFVDLRSIPSNSWLQGAYTAYPFGYQEDFAIWYRIVDGFYYIHEMYPDIMIKKDK